MDGARHTRRTADTRSPAGGASAADASQRRLEDTGTDRNRRSALRYEPNPKHKEPWQRGARGSLCPKDADGPTLLAVSEIDPQHPGKRYATDGTRAYCGHEHLPGRWHGFPVEWRAVPEKIRNAWLASSRVSKRAVREHW
jgi:hypothetical protein